MDSIRISWSLPDKDGGEAAYLVNGAPAGAGQAGFETILEMLTQNPGAAIVLEFGPLAGSGGKSVRSMMPFSDRYAEFAAALGGRDATLEFR
jgi:hypothetical protein